MGYLDGKTVAVTGAGRGIGRAVAMACAASGANVVVNDFGVSIDGNDPSSEIANEVVAEIVAAGGNAVAVADTVTTMEGESGSFKLLLTPTDLLTAWFVWLGFCVSACSLTCPKMSGIQ